MKTQNFGRNKILAFLGAMLEYALIPPSSVGSDNKAFRNVITPRSQEKELGIRVEEKEPSKGKHYTIFHTHVLFRDPQITSIWSYSVKKPRKVFWKWQTIWEWGQSCSKTTLSSSVVLFITQRSESNTNISVGSVSVCWEHGLPCRRPDYRQI